MSKASVPVTRIGAAIGLAFAMAGSVGMAHAAASSADTTRVVIEFKPGSAAVASARAAIANAGGQVKREILRGGAVAVVLPTRVVEALKRNPNILSVEEDAVRYPLALTTPSAKPYKLGQLVPYGIDMVQADQLPRGDLKTGNRKICIIDSGYDRTHEDLAANNVTGEFDTSTGWWYDDEAHHGTHVAGTIAAINNKGVGVVGVNPSKKLGLHIVKVFGAAGTWAYSSDLVAATEKCEAAGANIISMSLGGPLPSGAERTKFAQLEADGILSIAAAGNGGNKLTSYPAGYAGVMSVAAIDSTMALASFSQRNADVEIAGPGVMVLSTVPMGTGIDPDLKVGTTTYDPGSMDGSPLATVTAPLADFGLGDAVKPGFTGKVCLISRGNIDFSAKVLNCQNSGGVGAVIFNNVAGAFAGTLNGVATTIPSVSATDTDGAAMLGQLGQSATVAVSASNYAYFDGTSMATPHVSAVAAQVWSYFPTCTAAQIRSTLNKSALDLGAAGRDTSFGYGLVQARAAYDRLASLGCAN
ncbi:MAG TPA: S8 family serine peptidase [Ideonella sp.]|nr:S8 family serine peptidase [Ideonella sp.]